MAGDPERVHENDSEDELEQELAARDPGKYEDPLRGGLHSTNLVVEKYCKKWQPRHAFREFYQNWDDAIRQSNNLARRNFAKEPHHDATALCFKAIHPDTGAELGFIRLLKDKGVLELTNYNAWLPGKSLGIGGTSKTGNEQMAGSHGEGYKVAALTMKKHGFDVNTKASECDWEFLVPAQGEKHEGILCADIKKRRPARILTAKNAYARRQAKEGSITLRQNVWEDVTFTIGKEFKSFVTEGDFQQWINVALDLDPPTQVLETGFGNIILDDRFKNKVFLKGILLEDLSASSTLKFGYDIAQGEIDRERRRLASNQQAYQLAQIWGAAIRKELTMLMEYVTMLQSNIQPGDVKSAEIYMSRETTKLIWHHLVNEDVEHKKFYYDKENASEHVDVIINCLKKEPAPLSRPIWQKLRSYGLVRTPQERREYLLCNAPNSVKETTAYSSGVARALRGVLALDDRTRNLEVVFKSGVEAELDLLLHGWRVLINDKWLDFHASHDSGGCDLSVEASHQHVHIDTFDCGHITELYDSLVAELSRYQQRDRKLSAEASSALRRRAAEKIRQTPSRVSVAQGEKSGEIVVSWTEPESDRVWKNHRLLRKGRVTLHRESKCSHSKNEILSSEMAVDDDTASTDWVTVAACGCPEQIVPLKDSSATFTGLSQEEKYFPMISGIAPQSFFGFPPSALRPAAASQDLPANPNVDAVSSALDSTKSKETMQGDFNDLIDTSQDDDDDDDASKFYEDGNAGPYQSGTSTQTSISGSSNNSTRAGTPVSQQSSVNTQQARRSPTNIKLRTSNNEQNEQLQRAQVEIRRLEGELGTTQTHVTTLMNEVSRLIAEKESIRAELTSISENCNEKTQQLQAANMENQSQRLKLSEKEQALERLRLNIQEKEQQRNRISASLEDAETRLRELQAANENLRTSHDTATSEIERLNTDLHQLRTHNEQLTEDLEIAEKDVENAHQLVQGRKRARDAEQDHEVPAKRTKN